MDTTSRDLQLARARHILALSGMTCVPQWIVRRFVICSNSGSNTLRKVRASLTTASSPSPSLPLAQSGSCRLSHGVSQLFSVNVSSRDRSSVGTAFLLSHSFFLFLLSEKYHSSGGPHNSQSYGYSVSQFHRNETLKTVTSSRAPGVSSSRRRKYLMSLILLM